MGNKNRRRAFDMLDTAQGLPLESHGTENEENVVVTSDVVSDNADVVVTETYAVEASVSNDAVSVESTEAVTESTPVEDYTASDLAIQDKVVDAILNPAPVAETVTAVKRSPGRPAHVNNDEFMATWRKVHAAGGDVAAVVAALPSIQARIDAKKMTLAAAKLFVSMKAATLRTPAGGGHNLPTFKRGRKPGVVYTKKVDTSSVTKPTDTGSPAVVATVTPSKTESIDAAIDAFLSQGETPAPVVTESTVVESTETPLAAVAE